MTTSNQDNFIVLIEDNPDDEALTLRALRKNNIHNRVVVLRDGVEAQDYIYARGAYADRRADEIPDLILLDLKIPRVNGLEVLASLRTHPGTKLIPVVILTSSREEQDIMEAYHLGVNSYLCKSVDFEQFSETVRELGLYWLILNEPPPKGTPG